MNDKKVRQLELFAPLDNYEFQQISSIYTPISLDEGEFLVEQGETGEKLYVVVEGLLRVKRRSEEVQREKILSYLKDGSVVGEMATLANEDRTANVQAVRPTELIEFTQVEFKHVCEINSGVPLRLITMLSRRVYSTNKEIEAIAFRTVPGRLAIKLIELAENYGKVEPETGNQEIPFPLTHKALADMVGTNRETITRYINEFQNQGAIDIDDQTYTLLDREKLENWI